MFSWRQCNDELLDEGADILVGNHSAFPFLDTHDTLGNLYLKVALDLALASKTPMLLNLLTGEVRLLGIEDFSTTFQDLYLTLSATGFTAACTGQENAILVERCHQTGTLRNCNSTVAVDFNVDISAGRKIFFRNEQDGNNEQDDDEEYSYTC